MCYKQYFEGLYKTIVVEPNTTEPAITENKEPVDPPDIKPSITLATISIV